MDNGQVSATVVTITPSGAARFLEKNTNNRKIRPQQVDRYARDMAAGAWQVNGEAIKIDADGNLIDGQHRLLGCVQSDVSFRTLLIKGLAPEARTTIDMGAKRNFSDILRWKGEVSCSALAAAAEAGKTWDEKGGLNQYRVPHSNDEKMRWIAENPDIRNSVREALTVNKVPLRLPVSVFAPFHMRITRITPNDVPIFMEHLKSGAGLEENDPIHRLRGWLATTNTAKGSLPREDYIAVTIKAWNAWIQGREVRALSWKRGGAIREDFPTIIGADGRPYHDIMLDGPSAAFGLEGRESFPASTEETPEEIVI